MAALSSVIMVSAALMTGVGGDGSKPFERSELSSPHSLSMPDFLRPVDQAVADVSPLSVSLRQLAVELRMPADFDSVYRLRGTDQYVRADGALYAVFPQSVYANTEFGDLPLIPSNTVFYIGAPPGAEVEPGFRVPLPGQPKSSMIWADAQRDSPLMRMMRVDDRMVPMRLDEKADTRTDGSMGRTFRRRLPGAVPHSAVPPLISEPLDMPGTISGDAAYRTERISTLLQQAAEKAERTGSLQR